MRLTLTPRVAAAVPALYLASVFALIVLSGIGRGPGWLSGVLLAYSVPAMMMIDWMMPFLGRLGLVTHSSFMGLPNEAGFLLMTTIYSGICYILTLMVRWAITGGSGTGPR